jgi:hypothetical protein
MEKSPECLAQEDHCATCLGIARAAYVEALQEQEYRLDNKAAQVMAENARLEALIQEAEPLADFSCDDRRERAERIGANVGAKTASRKKS